VSGLSAASYLVQWHKLREAARGAGGGAALGGIGAIASSVGTADPARVVERGFMRLPADAEVVAESGVHLKPVFWISHTY